MEKTGEQNNSWVVCKFNDDGRLYVNSKRTREITVRVAEEMGQPIESVVLKEFPTFIEANNYKKEMEEVDKKLDELL